jgi:hypothetical protein
VGVSPAVEGGILPPNLLNQFRGTLAAGGAALGETLRLYGRRDARRYVVAVSSNSRAVLAMRRFWPHRMN